MDFERFGKWLLDRLKEKTTWVGIFSVIVATGAAVSPELQETISNAGIYVVSAIVILLKEKSI
jgi:hypothetical protein